MTVDDGRGEVDELAVVDARDPPRWLEWLPRIGAEGDAALPVVAPEPPAGDEPEAEHEPGAAPVPV